MDWLIFSIAFFTSFFLTYLFFLKKKVDLLRDAINITIFSLNQIEEKNEPAQVFFHLKDSLFIQKINPESKVPFQTLGTYRKYENDIHINLHSIQVYSWQCELKGIKADWVTHTLEHEGIHAALNAAMKSEYIKSIEEYRLWLCRDASLWEVIKEVHKPKKIHEAISKVKQYEEKIIEELMNKEKENNILGGDMK